MSTVVIRGTTHDSQRAERIVAAISCVASLRYAKKVLVLPMTIKYNVTDILLGSRLKQNAIKSKGYSFDDSGLDALMRRMEQGGLTAESFSDCCVNVAKVANSFDIAANSKRQDLAEYIVQNENFIKKFIQIANSVYDLVILLADAGDEDTLKILENLADTEATVIPQGNKVELSARPDTLYVINNYDATSIYNYKRMKAIYDIPTENKLYSVPYNIRFKDSCRSESAIEFMTTNVKPDQTDDNYVFMECLSRITGAILGVEEPLIREKKFVHKERPSKRK